jgi:hypothetical protein
MTKLDPAAIDELERLHAEATPAPWHWEDRHMAGRDYVPQGAALGETLIMLGDTYENSTEDCHLLEGLRNNAAALLSAARFAEKAKGFFREHAGNLRAAGYSLDQHAIEELIAASKVEP